MPEKIANFGCSVVPINIPKPRQQPPPPPRLQPPAALPRGSCQTGRNLGCAKSIYAESCIGMASHTGGFRGVYESRVILGWHAILVVSEFMSGLCYTFNNHPPPYSLRRRSRGGLVKRAKIGIAQSPSMLNAVLGWQAILVDVAVPFHGGSYWK